jgi:transposase-like protein
MMRDTRGGGYQRVEVLTGPGRRRAWDAATKARVVAESDAPGAVVSAVARRWRIAPQQLSTWRREARAASPEASAGKLGLDLENRSAALRDVVWSTAVQHGPGSLDGKRGPTGAAGVLQRALRSLGAEGPEAVAGLSDAAISDAVYAQRRTQFGRSTPDERAAVMRRFDDEGRVARERIAAEARTPPVGNRLASMTDPSEGGTGYAAPPPVMRGGDRGQTPVGGYMAPPQNPPPHASNWQPGAQGMGTPLPETEQRAVREKAQQQEAERQQRIQVAGNFQIADLTVVHQNGVTQETMGTQRLPVTQVPVAGALGPRLPAMG